MGREQRTPGGERIRPVAGAVHAWTVVLVACTGAVGDEQSPPWPSEGMGFSEERSGAGSAAGPGSVADPLDAAGNSPADQSDGALRTDGVMRDADPELFDIAERYFPGQSMGATPERLVRLTRTQLELTARSVLGEAYDRSIAMAMPRDPLQTNYEYASILSWNRANFTPYVDWVDAQAQRVGAAPEGVVMCAPAELGSACPATAARAFVLRAFRGVVSEAQLDRYVDFYEAAIAEVGLAQATSELVRLTLTAPGYVFRDEVRTDAEGRLLPAQHLQALTYTLADAPPEALGVDAGDPLAPAVERVLSSPFARDKLVRFFQAWLEVKAPDEFNIEPGVFPAFTPELAEAMKTEVERFLEHQLRGAAPSLAGVAQATESFVTGALADIYGVVGDPDGGPVALDPGQRLGVLTLPGVIASHSGPSTTRLVKRGVFFTRKVMCLPLGAPPPGIDTSVPESAGMTERERIETVTRSPTCQGCHAYINPFGFMLESYDPLGRFRDFDGAHPIDPSIDFEFLEEGPVRAETAVEALVRLTGSWRFQQCFVRQLFRFYMARDEVPTDDPLLRRMFFAFAQDGAQDILAAMRVMVGDRAFSLRSEVQ
ncbi:MAG: DUF1588 domain-containing protein [Myxococcales bacterium]|nr:DUF1588 domain-containing protein [Myxococcales bacterium]